MLILGKIVGIACIVYLVFVAKNAIKSLTESEKSDTLRNENDEFDK